MAQRQSFSRGGQTLHSAAPRAKNDDSRASQFGPEYVWNPPVSGSDDSTERDGWYERHEGMLAPYQQAYESQEPVQTPMRQMSRKSFAYDPGWFWQAIWAPQHGIKKHRYNESGLKNSVTLNPTTGQWDHKEVNLPYTPISEAGLTSDQLREFIHDFAKLRSEVVPDLPAEVMLVYLGVWTASEINSSYYTLYKNWGKEATEEARKIAEEVLPQALNESARLMFNGDVWRAWTAMYEHGVPPVPAYPAGGATTKPEQSIDIRDKDGSTRPYKITEPGQTVGREILYSRPDVFEQAQDYLVREPESVEGVQTIRGLNADDRLRDHITPAAKEYYGKVLLDEVKKSSPADWISAAITVYNQEQSAGRGDLAGFLNDSIARQMENTGLPGEQPHLQELMNRQHNMSRLRLRQTAQMDNELAVSQLVELLYRGNAARSTTFPASAANFEYISNPTGVDAATYTPGGVQEPRHDWELFAEGLIAYLNQFTPPEDLYDFLRKPPSLGGSAAVNWIAERSPIRNAQAKFSAMMDEVYRWERFPHRINAPGTGESGQGPRVAMRLKLAVPLGDINERSPEELHQLRKKLLGTPPIEDTANRRSIKSLVTYDEGSAALISAASFPVDTVGSYAGRHGPKNPLWDYVRENYGSTSALSGLDGNGMVGDAFLEAEINPVTGKPYKRGDEIGVHVDALQGKTEYPLLDWLIRHDLSVYSYPMIERLMREHRGVRSKLLTLNDAPPIDFAPRISQYYNRESTPPRNVNIRSPYPQILVPYRDTISVYKQWCAQVTASRVGRPPNVWSTETIQQTGPDVIANGGTGWLEKATAQGMERWEAELAAGWGLLNGDQEDDPNDPNAPPRDPRFICVDPDAVPVDDVLGVIQRYYSDIRKAPPAWVKTVHKLLSSAARSQRVRSLPLFHSVEWVTEWLRHSLPEIYQDFRSTYQFVETMLGMRVNAPSSLMAPPADTPQAGSAVAQDAYTVNDLVPRAPAVQSTPREQRTEVDAEQPADVYSVNDLPFKRAFKLSRRK